MKQERTAAYTSERNTMAERGIALIKSAAIAARLHVPNLHPNVDVPSSTWLWAAKLFWATDSLNRSSTRANPRNRSQYEMWHGEAAPTRILPFLKPGLVTAQRTNELKPEAQESFYLGAAANHASDVYWVQVKS